MCSYMSVCVSYATEKSRSCVQMTDWKNQLACELRQKRSADRAAGWTVLVVGQSNVLLSYTHSRVQSVVRANLSSAPGYRAASIAALAKFQLAQDERVQVKASQAQPGARMQKRLNFFLLISRVAKKHFLRTPFTNVILKNLDCLKRYLRLSSFISKTKNRGITCLHKHIFI